MQFFHFNICKKNIALKISYKIVALFTENYPSVIWVVLVIYYSPVPESLHYLYIILEEIVALST